MSSYGVGQYKNFWILILKYLPESLWCKLYLNKAFKQLIKSQISKDHILLLAKNGKIESLIAQGLDINIFFEEICQSNLCAIKRVMYGNNYQHDILTRGLVNACRSGKSDIVQYLVEIIGEKYYQQHLRKDIRYIFVYFYEIKKVLNVKTKNWSSMNI